MLETPASMLTLLRFFCGSLVFISLSAFAQRTCATEKLDSVRRIQNPRLESKPDFENWMGLQLLKKSSNANRTQSTYTIPVVVHVIHSGQAIGTGINITDAQVLSQISVLNKDFQRLNTDANNTPAEFLDEAAGLDVHFVLAKQDPDGNPTTGIVRVNGGRTSWSLFQDAELKAKSYWPAEKYFNVWVTSFNDYLGYAQFPVSNLPGVENSSNDRLTDGVIVHYQAFGSDDDGAFDLETQFNKGRTLTHEAGHFFGLRHIWGDANSCAATDHVADTPPQIGNSTGCLTHPRVQCAGPVMFQNYMDYTNDRCMNLFTAGQVARFEVVMQNSPRRLSLLTSPGSQPPGNFALDAGIVNTTEPTSLECAGLHTPTITIRNFGINAITSASIEMKINGVPVQTISPALNLNSLQQVSVSFNAYSSLPGDSHDFTFTILTVNGSADEYAGNNVLSVANRTARESVLPYNETFESGLTNWNIVNPDGLITWQQQSLSAPVNKALFIDLYDYENEGAVDRAYTPLINISGASGLLLKFKLAYAHSPGYDGDALRVYAQTGCTDDVGNATLIFQKEGSALGTTAPNSSEFTPTASQWKTHYVLLNSFVGSQKLRLAFEARNGYGNNIYIDSVQVIGDDITDLTIQQVIEPSPAVCATNVTPKLLVVNQGSVTINGFLATVTRNDGFNETITVNETLLPGMETVAQFSGIALLPGTNNFTFSVLANLLTDDFPTNNIVAWPVSAIVNKQSIPTREDFETSKWRYITTSSVSWTTANTNLGNSAVFKASEHTFNDVGATAWLVSPQLDMTKAVETSMFTDFSYAVNSPRDEVVTIRVSENCGQTFPYVVFDDFASELTLQPSSAPWVPSNDDHWRTQYVNLNNFAGQDDILVAIEAVSDNGNNLYVDNIEFFENDNPNPAKIEERFRVYSNATLTQTYLTFNLDEQQPAQVIVSNMQGAVITNIDIDNALNQTLTFQLNVAPGIYIFRVRIGQSWQAVKQYIGD